MRLCLIEDIGVTGLEPLTLTRAAYDLRLGQDGLATKIATAFGVGHGPARRGAWVRPHLAALQRERDPHTIVNDPNWLARGPMIAALARWVPPASFTRPDAAAPWVGLCDGRPACAGVGPADAAALASENLDDWFAGLLKRPDCDAIDVGGLWIDRPWDLVAANNDQLVADFARAGRVGISNRQLSTVAVVGPADRLAIHETARLDPYVVLDTTNGPITIAADVWVQPFTRIEGPAYIGPGTQLFRANLRGGVTIGPNCRVGGEVEATIIQGFTNKYHEGFLGHAYVGEWVNLGAITSNSDLRNDYGEVLVPLQGDPIATGQAKVGCFLGDHTRTGLGSMLNTGTSVGVMCNVLPAGPLLPKHVPSFTAVLYGRVAPGFPLDQMFQTARTVKGRRGQSFSAAEELFYRELYEKTRIERERAFHKHRERRPDPAWPVAARSV
jgi:UDP-N-acetylglucosamine diphosphorylase/glucosamine-1-phosphate N-acetyltransferase